MPHDTIDQRVAAAVAAILDQFPDGAGDAVVLALYPERDLFERWHPGEPYDDHDAVTRRVAALLQARGWPVQLFAVHCAAYDRWRGGRRDTRDTRLRYITCRGTGQPPYRLGIKLAGASRGRLSGEAGIGWCVTDLGPAPTITTGEIPS